MRFCRKCEQEKPDSEFQSYITRVSKKRHLRKMCKACANEAHVAYVYGLSLETIERTLTTQGGKCACCKTEISNIRGKENYRQIDHNHRLKKDDPGYFRGLLCNLCNLTLGAARDSATRLLACSEYIERTTSNGDYYAVK